jgi:hypothetical protein
MAENERRVAIRIPAQLAMEIRINDVDIARVESLNVSANGVYFSSGTYIPVLTKLDITLDLPGSPATETQGDTVVCSGVVVRSEPEEETPGTTDYQVACYFTSIDESDKETLECYILKQVAF